MNIEVLISTIDDGINKVKDVILPYRPDVRYLVSHQYKDSIYLDIPIELYRKDVTIQQMKGQGISRSRNNAILYATGDVCIIADDDVKYNNQFFDTVIETYEREDVEVACFKIFTGNGQPDYKKYPERNLVIKDISGYRPSSIEITFRRTCLRMHNILFDERFGLGTFLVGGEETIFLSDSLKKGLKIKFFAQFIVEHPFESNIKKLPKYCSRRLHLNGAIDARLYNYFSIIKAFIETLKLTPDLIKEDKNPFIYLLQRLYGVYYLIKTSE